MKTRIHVNQHVIRKNAKTGERKPVLTVYSPDKPLSCGAKVWIETEAEIIPVEGSFSQDPNCPVGA